MSAVIDTKSAQTGEISGTPTTQTVSQRVAIDASCRLPVLFFYSSAIFWLLIGSGLGFLASWQMHNPLVLADWGFTTFGRIRPAHMNSVVYGWASMAGMGTVIWMMARLCRVPLKSPGIPIVAGMFWNLGVFVGLIGIIRGDSQSIEWLEFPSYATPLLFISYSLIAVWAVIMFRKRRTGHVYVSQWYLLAALFWFPWLYGAANVLTQCFELRGVVLGAVNWWYGHNLIGLWFTPIGLASAYYFIPKVVGRPIHSYYLSALGFWSLALFFSWNGMQHLIGGPFPVWMITVSIASSMMMIIPVITVAINHHMTLKGRFHLLETSPTLRFTVFGAIAYTVVSLQGILMAFRSWNEITHFTHYTVGHSHLGLYAFFSMIMFGAMYYIVPRMVGCEWRSGTMIKWHFWLSAYGIIAMTLSLTVGGLGQGAALADADIPFMQTVALTLPYLISRSVTGVVLTVAHVIFALHFGLMLLRLGNAPGKPTYFTHHPGDKA